MKYKSNVVFKTLILNVLVVALILLCTGCLKNNALENELNNAEVLTFDGVGGYTSTRVYAIANKTYYFKVTNDKKINNTEYRLSYILAYDVNNDHEELTDGKAFGTEGTNAFWEIKVYNKNKQKIDFIGSNEGHLVDPMAENFYLDFNDTCYFEVTFREDIEIVFGFYVEELLAK